MATRISPMRTHNQMVERIVPITRSQFSFFEPSWEVGAWHDFTPLYRRMEEHMRQMNREINDMFRRFQRLVPLDHYTPNLQSLPPPMMTRPPALPAPIMATSSPSALTPSIPPPSMQMPPMPPPMSMADEWKLENPIVMEKDGSRRLKLEFDVRKFKPEEVTVRTQDNQLTVYARHEENGPNGRIFREYNRQFLLPETVQLETLTSVLSPEGVLTVTAPMPSRALPEPSRERVIPIEYKPKY